MFCSKCGTKSLEDSAFCQKCGAKLITDDTATSTPEASVSTVTLEPPPEALHQSAPIEQEYQQIPPNSAAPPAEAGEGLLKVAIIGRVLMGTSLLLLFLNSFLELSISPILIVVGMAIGTILSAFSMKWPFRMSKIIEVVIAALLLIFVIVYTVSSSGGNATPNSSSDSGNGDVSNLPNSNDRYVRMVMNGSPDAIPNKTYRKAFSAFFTNARWEYVKSDTGLHIVEFTGGCTYQGEPAQALIQFVVDGESERFEYYAFEINGVPQDEYMFWSLLEAVYGDDSASIAPDVQPKTEDGFKSVNLSQTYTDEAEGISLSYPSTWIAMGNTELRKYNDESSSIVGLFARNDAEAVASGFDARIFIDKEPENESFTASESEWQKTLSSFLEDVKITELSDIYIDGVSARKIVYSYYDRDAGKSFVDIRYIYMIGYDMYSVWCLSLQNYFDKYEPVFNAIMDSYTITVNPGSGSTEPNVGAPAGNNESRNPGSEYPGELLYDGVPVSSFFDLTIYDVIRAMGPPFDTDWYLGGPYYEYDGVQFFYDETDGRITYIYIDPRMCEVDGISLSSRGLRK